MLDKAKEAGRIEQQLKRLREQFAAGSAAVDNPDLSFSSQFTLACAYVANNMLNDALATYQLILVSGEARSNVSCTLKYAREYAERREI